MAGSIDITSIVAGIDFSDWTEHVLETATSLALAYDAPLTAVYAEMFQPPPYFTARNVERVKAALESQREETLRVLAETVEHVVKGRVKAVSVLEGGPASDAILRTALDKKAGLIILGTHGRTGMHRMMLGSIAEKVLREASMPVLTVRRPGRDGAPCRLPFETILCPYNAMPVAEEALRYAADLAQRYGARLKVMRCAEPGAEVDAEHFGNQVAEIVGTGCSWDADVRKGDAAETVLKTALDVEADLTVIGAQHRPLLETTIFGTTSIRVTRHAACPVLTVPRAASA